ncbi:MAG: pilus assembly protein [Burkholderiales bacterium]|nr:pilus assembly protein [Burkholderiales bacterium]
MRRGLHRQSGVAAVEFGLLLIFLVTIAFGGTELGRALYQYNVLAKSSREAVRVMSIASGSANEAAARCIAVYAKPTCSDRDTPVVDGLSTGQVYFIYDTVNNGVANVPVVRVEIREFQFVSLMSWAIPDMTFGPIGSTMRQGAA